MLFVILCLCLLLLHVPLHDALVRADDGGLDVDGMVPHPSQLHGLLQSSHHEQSVVSLCSSRHKDTRLVTARRGR